MAFHMTHNPYPEISFSPRLKPQNVQVQAMECFVEFFIIVDSMHPTISKNLGSYCLYISTIQHIKMALSNPFS